MLIDHDGLLSTYIQSNLTPKAPVPFVTLRSYGSWACRISEVLKVAVNCAALL